jgi:TetR/AcrR family transcriptional regulator
MKRARNKILDVAIELFARKGYAACSIREICEAAGVTKPVLYYHFRSKEHLYRELMIDLFNTTRKNLLRISNLRGCLRDRLVDYVSAEYANVRKDPNSMRFLFRMMFSPEGEYPYFNFIEEFKRERKAIADLIENDIGPGRHLKDPEMTASALMGMMLIQVLEHLFTGRRTLVRRSAEKLVDILLPAPRMAENAIPAGIARGGRR